MQAFIALVRRELGSFFKSWTGYVIIAGAMFLIGFSFWSMLEAFNSDPTPIPITQLFYETLYFWLILLVVSPLITMRTFALEKSSGTYETLMTTPVGDAQVVLAKFIGALLFYLILWLPLLACIGVVRYYSHDPTALDPATIGTTYLGIGLIGSVYLSLGIFTSAMTRSQIIAAMFSFAVGITLFMLSFLGSAFATKTGWEAQFIAHLALVEHMRDFAQGIVDSRPVVLYLTLTSFFLFLSWKSVESRRWK
ncbi:MAG: ABC transporter permease subunit [Verrucomicrobia bacterium]|nr:ABC transporter permease subunit [Verrucomicrobiota bacterium]